MDKVDIPKVGLQTTSHPSLANAPQIGVVVLESVENHHHRYPKSEARKLFVL